MRKTKIICTLGPAVDDIETIKKLLNAGVSAVRLNFSHGSHEEHLSRLNKFKAARDALGVSAASILDTKGPEVRIRTFGSGHVTLRSGAAFTITTDDVAGDEHRVSTTYVNLHNELKPGNRILLDDGLIELRVTEVRGRDVVCMVTNGGELSDHKSMNIPDVNIKIASLSEADERDILFAVANDMDFIAASFIRSAADVAAIREVLKKHGGENIKIIAKIENREGIKNLTDIVEASDAVMVARGDLGVEIDAWEVPIIQKRMIRDGTLAGKPVIVATQMLDSMIRNPRPTRAEVSDVANAVFDGASCVMLSGETAAGKYPLDSVITMDKTIRAAESAINFWKRFNSLSFEKKTAISDAISHACCTTAMDLGASAIITVTSSGHTARMISRFRPQCPIVALTEDDRVRRQLSISWGVTPKAGRVRKSTDELFEDGLEAALETKLVKKGDTVVLTAGVPVGTSGSTNLIKAQQIS
ncbi:pyruvate kinase [Sporobacter termitidis DSM 10068]|uniref:Pyruvate kinase n=1 Tax=Sporobacter termitidis DSM 10068 TaxID=1123282 RepID=A0A1M5ZDH1_9FIRM|nr:pyruvate kinase [Sporobacter termitidis]SHI22246.1 pyruvate kinase [Sporobacter termitidis DSM 10068]